MSAWRKYSWIGLTSARSNLAYFSDVLSRIFFLSVILYIFLRLWQVTYSQTGAQHLGDLSIAQMLWYLTITEAIVLSAPRVAQVVDEDVRTGSLAVQLIRPLSYPLYRLWSTLGERVVRFAINLGVGSIIAFLLVGAINWQATGLTMFALSLPLAFVLDFLSYFLIGLGAFWLEDTSGLVLLYSRMTMILGGVLIPIDLYPAAIKPFVRAMPFSSIAYGPAHLFVHPGWSEFGNLIGHQAMAIVFFGLFTAYIYRMALGRVFANGG